MDSRPNLQNRFWPPARAFSISAPTFESKIPTFTANFMIMNIPRPNFWGRRFMDYRKFIVIRFAAHGSLPVRAVIQPAFWFHFDRSFAAKQSIENEFSL